MNSSMLAGHQAIRRAAASLVLIICSTILPLGCGEPETNQTNIPADFAAKLEKDHPEFFVKKIGRNKTEVVSGRDKKDIIRREWLKSQGSGE